MKTIDYDYEFKEFQQEVALMAEGASVSQWEAFFSIYAEVASENGDCGDLVYQPVRRDGTGGYQVDGYLVDTERNELHLAICDYRPNENLEVMNAAELDSTLRRVKRFCEAAINPYRMRELEEASPEWEVVSAIQQYRAQFSRIRIVLLTNARLATRRKVIVSQEIIGADATFNVVDFNRYVDILEAQGGIEDVELNFAEIWGSGLPCVPAHIEQSDVKSYLVVMPGDLLARLYGLYGPRLMEQNVRTYLQARTKVNKGILETIRKEPARFFAYNNGLTSTATGLTFEQAETGLVITCATNLQIVNGGQTTASLLHAKDQLKSDLSQVFVQMKLSVVSQEQVEGLVPQISRFANTQNRISEADFFSNHPFHVEMQKISRQATTPSVDGKLVRRKWFYERARGQYRNELINRSSGERRKFELEYPRSCVVQKTDAAKYHFSFECEPHTVSLGAQKCFLEFAKLITDKWGKSVDSFNEGYFRRLIAKAILFRWVDDSVGKAEWYKADRGYKANITTYTVAWLSHAAREQFGCSINLEEIWREQAVPTTIQRVVEEVSPRIAKVIKTPVSGVVNITEYAKKSICWIEVQKVRIELPEDFQRYLITEEELTKTVKDDRTTRKLDKDIEIDTIAVKLAPKITYLERVAKQHHLVSAKNMSAIGKIKSGRFNFSKSERNALAFLISSLDEKGVGIKSIIDE